MLSYTLVGSKLLSPDVAARPRVSTLVAVNEAGLRVGEDHASAKLTDAEVDQMRELREDKRWSLPRLAVKFSVSVSTAHSICAYKSRAQRPAAWKRPPRGSR
jgi:hypothetical protein